MLALQLSSSLEEVETRSATYRRTGGVPFSGESGVLPIPKRHKCHDRQQYILAHWRVIAGLPQ